MRLLIGVFYFVENELNEADSLERIKGIHGEVKLCKDDPSLKVYCWGLEKGMYTDEVAEIIIKGRIDHSRIATRGPTSVENNTVFAVDTSKLTDKDDVKCDDLGAWDYTGSKSIFYRMDEDGKLTKVNKKEETDKEVGIFVIKRRSYTNLSLKYLRRITMTATETVSTCPKYLVFIQYIFEEGEQQVQAKQHGNAKSSRSCAYKRTMSSTRNMIREQTGTLPPQK